ncbi:tRNA (adenosine(37)-N6)-threonylcarbamoyltransferase complex ATPase subunit type 1 TsaE, partial [Pseudomonas viridiflava]
LIRGFGHEGAVKSPTFTLVEPYEIGTIKVFHFDLYRLVDPEELEFMGVRDYFDGDSLCLIEWPQRGAGFLPKPDLTITISPHGEGRSVILSPTGSRGERWCATLALE